MSVMGSGKSNELAFQNDMLKHLLTTGWLLGKAEHYNRELALYPEDLLGFVQDTQPEQWKKFCTLYPNNPSQSFLERVATQLNKTDPNAASKEMRTYGTLGVLRHELKDRGTRFSLCQFKPEHDLNPIPWRVTPRTAAVLSPRWCIHLGQIKPISNKPAASPKPGGLIWCCL